MSKSPLWERVVSYGAVGATKAPDLMTYPPEGFRPFEERTRIGHGDARWAYAWQEALTWGIQRRSGIRVTLSDSPREVGDGTYTPVSFDTGGTPIVPDLGTRGETVYGPGGQSFIAPGDTAMLTIPFGPFRVHAPCRVIYVIDEPKRKGFAYGTIGGHPESGEEAFIVDQTDDGSVWLTIRAFSRPASWAWRAVYPALRFAQAMYTRRYFRSLSGPIG